MIIWIWKACKNMEIGYYITSLLYADVTPLYRDGHATKTADMQWCESWSICDFVAICCHIHIFFKSCLYQNCQVLENGVQWCLLFLNTSPES